MTTMMNTQAALHFRRIGILTIFAVYCVILMGGIVRASGAGMGCPDWPTCFGQWIPPTEESQLPANYHEIYAQRGYENTQFNPVKTWTEYTNRLVGVTHWLFNFSDRLVITHLSKKRQNHFLFILGQFFSGGFSGLAGFKCRCKQPETGHDHPAHAVGIGYSGLIDLYHCPIATRVSQSN